MSSNDVLTAPRPAKVPLPSGQDTDDLDTYVPFRTAFLARPETAGVPIRTYGGQTGWLAVLLVALLASLGLAAATMSFSRKETAKGALTPEAGVIQIVPIRSGVVSAVHVRDGQAVAIGAPLITLSLDADIEGGRMGDILTAAADAQETARHQAESARAELLDRQRDELVVRRNRLKDEAESVDGQRPLLQQQIEAARDMLDKVRPVHAKGFMSTPQFRTYENAFTQATLTLSNLDQRRSAIRREFEQADVESRRLDAMAREARAQVASSEAAQVEKRTGLEGQRSMVLTASSAGRVAGLRARRGESISGGASVGAILPQGSGLIAEIWLPSTAIGFVRKGDPVRLMYDGFPHAQFGMGNGKVAYISEAPVIERDPGTGAGQARYLVKVALERQSVRAFDRDWPLAPGMGVDAIIILEKRSLIRWALEPLFKARGGMA